MNRFIIGKSIILREVKESDANFILDLRLNDNLNRFISKIDNNLESQINFIKNVLTKKDEIYFIIQSKDNESYGTVRIYEIKNDDFTWGSWIINKEAPLTAGIESALLIYEYAFFTLNLKKCHFKVTKGNDNVIRFHKKFGAIIIKETEEEFFFTYKLEDYLAIKPIYERFLQ